MSLLTSINKFIENFSPLLIVDGRSVADPKELCESFNDYFVSVPATVYSKTNNLKHPVTS